MKRILEILPLALAVVGLAAIFEPPVRAQEEPTLDAKRRVFFDVGAGFRTIRRGPDGSYYVLAAPIPTPPSKSSKTSMSLAPAVVVFDPQGKKLRQIPAQPRRGEIVSPHSLDVDASGRVYIADLGGNAVSIYAVDGTLLREFGELADLSDDAELNYRVNLGHLASDKAGNLYFAFRYLREPTVRKYAYTSGNLLDELSLTTLDLQPMAQSARQEIARIASGKAPVPHEIISGFGVDPETQELWLALGNLLMHFDNADNNTVT